MSLRDVQDLSFETPPTPIRASKIKTKKTADVVVLGLGLSGLCAALAASEGRKSSSSKGIPHHPRRVRRVIGDRQHKAQKIKVPKDQVMADIMRFGGTRQMRGLSSFWIDESGRIMDKLLDMADKAGVKYAVDTDGEEYLGLQGLPPSHQFFPRHAAFSRPCAREKCQGGRRRDPL